MSMTFASDGGDEDEVVSAINTTPLVDVMLVLLIIFLITIPVVTHTVPLTLPKETNVPMKTKPENINLSVDREGSVFWNEQKVADNEALVTRLKRESVKVPQPEVQIRGGRCCALRVCRQGRLRLSARRDRQDRLHHRAAAEGLIVRHC